MNASSPSAVHSGSGSTAFVSIPTEASPADIYELLTDSKSGSNGAMPKGKVLPPGWERIVYQGSVVYVDHISREAHEEPPWEVWRRRGGATE